MVRATMRPFLIQATAWLCWLSVLAPLSDACYDNIASKGVTYPVGDINRTVGQNLSITCTITDDSSDLPDSGDIVWRWKDGSVPSQFVTVVDRRSARLDIPHLTVSQSGHYWCVLNTTHDTLCMNTVSVGIAPPKVTSQDFTCLSQQWKNMTCSWNAVPTGLLTNWTLQLRFSKNRLQGCPDYIKNAQGENRACRYGSTGGPGYDMWRESFVFLLKGVNGLGTSSSEFVVDHFSRVIAAAPVGLTVYPYGSTAFKISWELDKEFQHFPKGLVYRVEYRSQWDHPDTWKHEVVKGRRNYTLMGLSPYTKYKVAVRCRSERAADVETMWSQPIATGQTTAPSIPGDPVRTTFSSFEDVYINVDRRNITIFWQPLPPAQYYGPDFHYVVDAVDGDVIVESKRCDAIDFRSIFSALYKNKSYKFVIRAWNSQGHAIRSSEVLVPKTDDKPPLPESFNVFAYKNGVFELSWSYPPGRVGPSAHTIFWCKAVHPRLDPCHEAPLWKVADGNDSATVTVEEPQDNYRFGVAADDPPTGSGLVWSKCVAAYDGVASKVKMGPLKSEGPDRFRVTWFLDCADRLGILEGFDIHYCPYSNATGTCIGEELTVQVDGPEVVTFVVVGLTPFTAYNVSVSARTKVRAGEACDPHTITTDEAAPSYPPMDIEVQSVTEKSIHLTWKSPNVTNGRVTHFEIFYNAHETTLNVSGDNDGSVGGGVDREYGTNLTHRVLGYANYSIYLTACTSKGCSPLSQETIATTNIGVPGPPREPRVSLINETHAQVEWDDPAEKNGPLQGWSLLIRWSEGGRNYSRLVHPKGSPHVVAIQCQADVAGAVRYSFAVCATNYRDNETLVGAWSPATPLNACFPMSGGLLTSHLVLIALGSCLLAFLLGVFIRYKAKGFWQKIREMQKIEVDLPKGLVNDPYSAYNGFTKNALVGTGHQHRSQPSSLTSHTCPSVGYSGRLQSISSDEGRSSMESEQSSLQPDNYSFGSAHDENCFLDGCCNDVRELGRHARNLSGDSGGFYSGGEGSVSSSLTTHTQLSCDSGSVHYQPPSPDSVFPDCPWSVPGLTVVRPTTQLRMRGGASPLHQLGEEAGDDGATDGFEGDRPGSLYIGPVREDADGPGRYCKIATSSDASADREGSGSSCSEDDCDVGDFQSASVYSKLGCTVERPLAVSERDMTVKRGSNLIAPVSTNSKTVDLPGISEGDGVSSVLSPYVDASVLSDGSKSVAVVGYSKLALPNTCGELSTLVESEPIDGSSSGENENAEPTVEGVEESDKRGGIGQEQLAVPPPLLGVLNLTDTESSLISHQKSEYVSVNVVCPPLPTSEYSACPSCLAGSELKDMTTGGKDVSSNEEEEEFVQFLSGLNHRARPLQSSEGYVQIATTTGQI